MVGLLVKEKQERLRLESGSLVYLAGPVRALGRDRAIMIRSKIESLLYRNMGVTTFNPPGAWLGDGGPKSEEFIRVINLQAVAMCDTVAVTYVRGVTSKGTDEEVGIAANMGKNIVVFVHDETALSSAIAWATGVMIHRPKPTEVRFCHQVGEEVLVLTKLTLGKTGALYVHEYYEPGDLTE